MQSVKDKDAVVAALKTVAPLYNQLYAAAKAALVPLPGRAAPASACLPGYPPPPSVSLMELFSCTPQVDSTPSAPPPPLPTRPLPCPPAAEAVATMKREASPFRYDDTLAAAAADWGSFKDEGGWVGLMGGVCAIGCD